MYKEFQSADVARAAIRMALSEAMKTSFVKNWQKVEFVLLQSTLAASSWISSLKFMSLPLLQPSVSMLSLIHMLAMGPLSEPWNPLSSRSSLWRWG